jgi:3-oxoacyl-[acyl-carrier-protein] synthase II
MAASGAIESAACIGMMHQGELVPTRNLDQVDEGCRGLLHLQRPQLASPKIILKNNFAMGGINCTLILRSGTHD